MRVLQLWAVVLFLALPVHALDVPPRPAGRVSDFAGVLHSDDGRILADRLRAFEEATSNQVVIAIFPSLEGENLEEFTNRLANSWGIGQEDKDNGVVIAVYMAERKIRIEVGYGLEGALPDVVCKRIIDEEMRPRIKEGQYAGGLSAAVEKIMSATRGEYRAQTLWDEIVRFVEKLLAGWRELIFIFAILAFPVGLTVLIAAIVKSFTKRARIRRHAQIFAGAYFGLMIVGWLAAGLVGMAGGFALAFCIVVALDSGMLRIKKFPPLGVVVRGSGMSRSGPATGGDDSSNSGAGGFGGDSFDSGDGSFGGGGASGDGGGGDD